MRGIAKPLSSPSRAEKFPPPLMWLMRSNVGSRSRSRARSSPMFYLRGRRSAVETSQEPSSPKVTCIGQVHARRSSKAAKKRRRWWLCFRKNPLDGMLCKCGSIFGWNYNKKADSFRAFPDCKTENLGDRRERDYTVEKERKQPPKNALMLTRCRSAPYRSSSLGAQFLKDAADEVAASSITGEEMESSIEEMKKSVVHPLLLTRCKSEPASLGDRLVAVAQHTPQQNS
ncbi:hypothetical protein SASPL_102276 [Salvia splendens]|uniref:Uncharacterized protein n=1 Tax=Salvia splendens TaxID=180675 RepID=A0A8X8YRK9_SALSN|nr:uncharacterized protein LOC121780741 [Salvia splendens]KAG6437361.1 hypothetical protein SASPL_102276 [Salvia splendens]